MKNKKITLSTILIILLLIFVVALFAMYPSTISRYFSLGMGLMFLCGTVILIQSSRTKSKNSNSFGEILGTVLICIIMIPVSILFIYSPFKDNFDKLLNINSETKADGFTIEGYGVILDVGMDNKVNVTEIIYANFYEDGHHGIYKFTPNWLEYTGKDGQTIKRKSEVLNYRAEGEEYKVENVGGKPRIRIGRESTTVSGLQEYIIKYTYDMGKDPFNGFDEFIFHAFGDYWGTEIKNPMISIYMPRDMGDVNINVFTDKYRKNNVNNLVNIEREGNSINITSKDLKVMKSLTVDVELPDHYFIGGSNNYGNVSLIISIVILVLTVYIIYMWARYGKDEEKQIPTVEFYAPDNLNPAEIGYVYNNGRTSRKLTISLIVQLASKGYIRIDEIKGQRKKDSEIQITNLYKKVKSETSLNYEEKKKTVIESKQEFVIKRLNGSKELTDIERKEYNSLFGDNSYIKTISIDDEDFIKIKDSLVDKGYIEILKDSVNTINEVKEETEPKEPLNKPIETNDKQLPELDEMEQYIYDKLFISSDIVILSEHSTIYESFGNTDKLLKDEFNSNVYDVQSQKKRNATLIIATILLLLSLMSFFDIEDMIPSMRYLYFISFGCVVIDYIFAFIMVKRTTYGEALSARVKGFRDFLVTAEKDKLESLVEKNPHYFYDILPYTYVLNISKKWIEKFQDIKMPESDIGNISRLDGDILVSSIASSISFPASSGSGGGGGGSSCGGGCSSCGGGGSW